MGPFPHPRVPPGTGGATRFHQSGKPDFRPLDSLDLPSLPRPPPTPLPKSGVLDCRPFRIYTDDQDGSPQHSTPDLTRGLDVQSREEVKITLPDRTVSGSLPPVDASGKNPLPESFPRTTFVDRYRGTGRRRTV